MTITRIVQMFCDGSECSDVLEAPLELQKEAISHWLETKGWKATTDNKHLCPTCTGEAIWQATRKV